MILPSHDYNHSQTLEGARMIAAWHNKQGSAGLEILSICGRVSRRIEQDIPRENQPKLLADVAAFRRWALASAGPLWATDGQDQFSKLLETECCDIGTATLALALCGILVGKRDKDAPSNLASRWDDHPMHGTPEFHARNGCDDPLDVLENKQDVAIVRGFSNHDDARNAALLWLVEFYPIVPHHEPIGRALDKWCAILTANGEAPLSDRWWALEVTEDTAEHAARIAAAEDRDIRRLGESTRG